MIDDKKFRQFMEIDTFPDYSTEYFKVDPTLDYFYAARAEYSFTSEQHKLLLPEKYDIPECILFHELTHILDAERYSNGNRSHDYGLTGYMEYHASQVELMVILGAKTINDKLAFSMQDRIGVSNCTIQYYVEKQLETAKMMISDSDQKKRIEGIGVLFNFLGSKSICNMYATDYCENYNYKEIVKHFPSFLFLQLRELMQGWVKDIEKTTLLYVLMTNAVV